MKQIAYFLIQAPKSREVEAKAGNSAYPHETAIEPVGYKLNFKKRKSWERICRENLWKSPFWAQVDMWKS